MEVLEKIEDIIKSLGIKAFYQVADSEVNEYITFDIYSENDTTFCDDSNLEVEYHITLNYWHKGKSYFKNYKKIKEAFKNEGFFFDSMKTLRSSKTNVFGKNYTFKYEEEN